MTKQETIKQHYITEFINSGMLEKEAEQKWEGISEFVDDNGWLDFLLDKNRIRDIFHNQENIEVNKYLTHWRPISLRGIETNNGWTSILSEKDLPSEDIDCEFITKKGNQYIGKCEITDGEVFFIKGVEGFSSSFITHYAPIIKRLRPLH